MLCLGFASITPKQDASFQYYSNILPHANADGAQGNCETSTEAAAAPKPKKFFKSRNSVPDAEQVLALESQLATTSGSAAVEAAPAPPAADKISLKISRKQSRKGDAAKKAKAPKAPKPEKVVEEKPEKSTKKKKKTKAEEKPVKTIEQAKPTRVLSRTRKAVDYAEQNSRSPTPKSKPNQASDATPAPLTHYPTQFEDGQQQADVFDNQNAVASSPSKNSAAEHPPIVLRISKVSVRICQSMETEWSRSSRAKQIESGQLQCK